MASGWKLLHQAFSDPKLPTLLLKYEFGVSSYKIWFTDLTSIWVEELKQRPLIQRAWDIESDIDPVESDQRQMLLRRIQDSLDEKSGTKITLARDQSSSGLLLTAYSPLPHPLQPLKWPIRLNTSSQSSLTNELILPLLAEKLLARDQIASLVSSLTQKDHVITKLTDKMQNEGIELGKVFPSAISSKSSRKASSRDEVGKVVQGLATFDEHQWSSQLASDRDVPGGCRELISELFAHDVGFASTTIAEQVDVGAWWERLGNQSDATYEEKEISPPLSLPQSAKRESPLKAIPHNLPGLPDKQRLSREAVSLSQKENSLQDLSPKTMDGDSTTDTSDDDLDSKQIKGRDQVSVQPIEKSSSSSNSNSPEPRTEPRNDTLPKSMPLLGRIGGTSEQTISPTKPKLGQVGGIAMISKKPSDVHREGGVQPRIDTKSPSLPRETSPERADRKREQLKRELEEKSKAVNYEHYHALLVRSDRHGLLAFATST
ncbi:MAG: hypothetical protein Q9198_004538 [Flavoplaca austrocitrina]